MSVITTPAPTLPVRGEHFRQAVSPMLSRLAAERATGVLLRESGSLYLSEGEVVHAESPRSPGLDVLLTTGGTLDADGWREAVDTAGAGLRVGRFLVDSGRVARGALELCHAGALFDAAYFVLGPSSAPASFRYGAAHWLGPIRPVPVAAVEREARRRRDLLHRIWPDPATDDAPLVRARRPGRPAGTGPPGSRTRPGERRPHGRRDLPDPGAPGLPHPRGRTAADGRGPHIRDPAQPGENTTDSDRPGPRPHPPARGPPPSPTRATTRRPTRATPRRPTSRRPTLTATRLPDPRRAAR